MAIANVGGDKLVLNKEYVTTAADLADKTLITAAGAAVSSGALATGTAAYYGVIEKDTPSGGLATVKTHGILEVLATGTVTKGSLVEALQGTVYANINGTKTSTISCGVTNIASGYPVGKAMSTSDAYGTVLVAFFDSILGAQKVA